MTLVPIEEMQRDLLNYLQRVEAGETLVITRSDEPVAEIKPIRAAEEGLRPFGLAAGEFTVADDFDDALPAELLRAFEKGGVLP